MSAPEELKIPTDREVVAQQIAEVLTSRKETLAVVETSAGGLISSILTDIAGALRLVCRIRGDVL